MSVVRLSVRCGDDSSIESASALAFPLPLPLPLFRFGRDCAPRIARISAMKAVGSAVEGCAVEVSSAESFDVESSAGESSHVDGLTVNDSEVEIFAFELLFELEGRNPDARVMFVNDDDLGPISPAIFRRRRRSDFGGGKLTTDGDVVGFFVAQNFASPSSEKSPSRS